MAHPVDIHVGRRVRLRRWFRGMTQLELGERVGIRFQQIQKYEAGTNRISASRMWEIAAAMEVPMSYFFEGIDGQPSDTGEASGHILTDKKRSNWFASITRSRRPDAHGSSAVRNYRATLGQPKDSKSWT